MPHRFAFAFVIHKVLLQASGITNETKLFVTKLQAPKTDEFLIEQKAKHRSNAVAYCGVLTHWSAKSRCFRRIIPNHSSLSGGLFLHNNFELVFALGDEVYSLGFGLAVGGDGQVILTIEALKLGGAV